MARHHRPVAVLLELVLVLLAVTLADARTNRIFSAPVAFVAPRSLASSSHLVIHALRGGATDDSDDEESDNEEEEDESESEDEEEEEVVAEVAKPKSKSKSKSKSKTTKAPSLDAKLAASTLKKEATSKVKVSKQAVNAKLSAPKKVKRRMSLRIPYIVRACCNPITLIKMTAAYWQSLFQLDYGNQVSQMEAFRESTMFLFCYCS